MDFNEFIASLNEEDKKNYLQYSPIRGVQTYKIIYNELMKMNPYVTYGDVNAFVKYDKAIKDVLYKYIGTLEDLIRKHIFKNFDLKKDVEYHEYYEKCSDLKDIIVRIDNKNDDVTKLYSSWSLMMKETIKFLRKYDKNSFDLNKLEQVRKLRNKVMHHSTLVFDCHGNSKCKTTYYEISCLHDVLPENYSGISKEINDKTNITRKNIKNEYKCFLLELLEE